MAAEQECNIKFVQEVEKYPFLFNSQLPDYMRKDKIEKAWTEIGEKFQISGPECKEKWRNIRSVFVRHIRRKNGAIHKKPYYLAEFMKFATPFIKVTNGNVLDTSQEAFSNDTVLLSQSPSEQNYELEEPDPIPIPRKRIKRSESTDTEARVDQDIAAYFRMKRTRMIENHINDESSNKMFLLSLLTDMNEMNDKQRRLFRRKVLEIIDDILD